VRPRPFWRARTFIVDFLGQNVKVSSVETTTVITDPEDPKAVQIPEQADATGRDELAVHAEQSPLEQIADF